MTSKKEIIDQAKTEFRYGKHEVVYCVARDFGLLSDDLISLVTWWVSDPNENLDDLRITAKAIRAKVGELEQLLNRFDWEEAKSLSSLVTANTELQEVASHE
jgi:hypothetical protein